MKISIEKTFENREELDSFIRTTFGENPESNKNLVLEIDAETQSKLQLSNDTTIHGAKVVSPMTTDVPAADPVAVEKPV